MDPERLKKVAERLSRLKQEAEAAQDVMYSIKQKAGSSLTDLALTHFSELNEMSADDIRKFGSIIKEYCRSLAEDLNKLNYKVKTGG